MRQIFNKLDTTPDPSYTAKLKRKADLCDKLEITQGNTAGREAAVKTAMAEIDEAIAERDAAQVATKTAKAAASKLNPSIAPIGETANRLEKINNMETGKRKARKAFQASFKPRLNKEVMDALEEVVTKMNKLATKEQAVTDKAASLKEAEDLLAKNAQNIKTKTAQIAAVNASMVGLNCGGNPDGCDFPSVL